MHVFFRYTFTDLAQMVCQVSPGSRMDESSDDSDDDMREGYEGYASEPSAGILDVNILQLYYIIHIRLWCILILNI